MWICLFGTILPSWCRSGFCFCLFVCFCENFCLIVLRVDQCLCDRSSLTVSWFCGCSCLCVTKHSSRTVREPVEGFTDISVVAFFFFFSLLFFFFSCLLLVFCYLVCLLLFSICLLLFRFHFPSVYFLFLFVFEECSRYIISFGWWWEE